MLNRLICDSLANHYKWWNKNYTQNVYGILLYTTSTLDYAGCTVLTDSGLNAAFKRYRRDRLFKDKSDEQLRAILRYSPCDSPHHMKGKDAFKELNERLGVFRSGLDRLNGKDYSNALSDAYSEVIDGILMFRKSCIPLTNKSVFVSMLWGDITNDEAIRFIRKCNSRSVA